MTVLSSFLPTAPDPETNLNPEMTMDSQTTGDPTVTSTVENPSEDSITPSNSNKESTTGEDRGLSGPSVNGLQKRKVSVADDFLLSEETPDQTGGKTDEHCEDQTTANLEVSKETPQTHTVPEQGGVDTNFNAQTSANTHCTDSDGKLECHGNLDAPTSDCPHSGEGSNSTLKLQAQRKAKRGRRSSAHRSLLQEQGNQAEEHQGDQQEIIMPSSDSQEEGGAASLNLAPWQADFNIEDVFKPVATRRQRSVRRSLRNQSNADHSSSSVGLAWLPQTPPDSSKEARRRTRGRRLSAAPPVQPSLPEETQDNTS